MIVDLKEKTYEGVNALSALAMAVFEECGLGQVIADAVGDTG